MMRAVFMTLALGYTATGCTTTSTPTEHISASGEDRGVVRNNKKQPQWAVDMVKPKDAQNTYFVSIVEKSYKLNLGIDKAKTDAIGNLAQMIGADIVKSAANAATGDATIADGVQESFDTATAALSKTSITGATVEDVYWEEIRGESGSKNYFSISVLVAVPNSEVARAAKIWLDKFNKSNASDALKENLKKKVEDYNAKTEQ